MSKCGKQCCEGFKLKICSVCLVEGYCSVDCQKADWKTHKVLCFLMKNENSLFPYEKICDIVEKLIKLAKFKEIENNDEKNKANRNKSIKILEYGILFAKKQFGERTIGSLQRSFRFNSTITNIRVDLNVLIPVYQSLCDLYFPIDDTIPNINDSNITVDDCVNVIKCYDNMLSILNYWDENKEYIIHDEIIDYVCITLNNVYFRYAMCKQYQSEFDVAIKHYDNAIYYLKKKTLTYEDLEKLSKTLTVEGKIKYDVSKLRFEDDLDKLCIYLVHKTCSLYNLSKYDDIKVICEEVYNITVDYYPCDHPKVLDKVNILVEILIKMEEYIDAERYARICYECLFRLNPESMPLYFIAFQLAKVTFKLIEQNTSPIRDLIDIKEVESLLIKVFKFRIKCNNDYVICQHIKNVNDTLYDVYTYMGKNKNEIQNLFDTNGIYYPIFDKNNK
jgi:hypothetical protein